jgi:endoglucanase
LNQIGFYPPAVKTAIVVGVGDVPFYVVRASTNDTVFTGRLTATKTWQFSNEDVSKADFSDLTQSGTYNIVVPGIGASNSFKVSNYVHQPVAIGALKGFYYQRASTRLLIEHANIWARPAGHPDTNVLVHASAATPQRPVNTVIRAPYGWYDAGDYNKYIVNSGITMYTLMALYEQFPAYCDRLQTNIPESGNSIPDLLDEVLWNLRWMLAMQDPNDGGVYTKLTNANFDGFVMPNLATTPRYVVKKSTGAALDFAAVMAQASRVYRKFNSVLPGLADSCLQASFNAWNWARRNPAVFYNQTQMNQQFSPAINTGEYGDGDFSDEFAWCAAELFVTTAQDSFLTVASPMNSSSVNVPGWQSVQTLGLLTLVHHRASIANKLDTTLVKNRILGLASNLLLTSTTSAYGTSMGYQSWDFVWGSNSVAANQGMILLNAYRLTGMPVYLNAALANLDYLLGRNGTTYCFVTGYGTLSPMHPHHRVSQSDNMTFPVPGLLVGGPNPGREDGVTTYPSTWPALCYTDDTNSYASNEIAINWNAPLVFLACGIETLMSPTGTPLSVHSEKGQTTSPVNFNLLQNYPNPFNPSTTIEYLVPFGSNVRIGIYNITGQLVRMLINDFQDAGAYRIVWNAQTDSGRYVPSGIYFCRLTTGTVSTVKKITVLR